MALYVLKSDITQLDVDAVVNILVSDRPDLTASNIIEKAVVKNAGSAGLQIVRSGYGVKADMIEGYGVRANYIVNVIDGYYCEYTDYRWTSLGRMFGSVFSIIKRNGLKSVAIPLLLYDNWRTPQEYTFERVTMWINLFIKYIDVDVFLIPYKYQSYCLPDNILIDVKAFIDNRYEPDNSPVTYYQMAPGASECKKSKLVDMVKSVDKSFAEALVGYIDEKGLKDPEVYRRAQMDKRTFHKIKNPEYHPSKKNALALAIALELNIDELKKFIDKAGYSLTRSDKRDIIVEYCVVNGQYDILEINSILFAFGQPLFEEKKSLF